MLILAFELFRGKNEVTSWKLIFNFKVATFIFSSDNLLEPRRVLQKINAFFPQKEFYYENFPESMLNEDIPNNEQDINFPNEFDLNTNEPNYEDNLFP